MTPPVVVITRDLRDRTVVSWYDNEAAWQAGDTLAVIVADRTLVAGRVEDTTIANRIADTWLLLMQVPDYDVSYLATHHVVQDLLEPLPGWVIA